LTYARATDIPRVTILLLVLRNRNPIQMTMYQSLRRENSKSSLHMTACETAKEKWQNETKDNRVRELRERFFQLKATETVKSRKDALRIQALSLQSEITMENTSFNPETHFATEYRHSTGAASPSCGYTHNWPSSPKGPNGIKQRIRIARHSGDSIRKQLQRVSDMSYTDYIGNEQSRKSVVPELQSY